MSAKPVVILLLLTLLLAFATYFVVKPAAPGMRSGSLQPGDKLIELEASKVSSIRINTGTQQHTLTRSGEGWTWSPAATAPQTARSWPLDASRVAAFLRLLADTRSAGPVPPGEVIAETPPPVVLTLVSASGERTFRFAPRALAGRVLVDTGEGLSLVSDDLLKVMTSPGPSAWRPSRLLGEAALNATQLSIAGQGEPITLRRNASRWQLDTPVREQADSTVVSKLLAALESLEIARYIDEPISPAQSGLDKPAATITLGRELRPGQPPQTTTLLLGGPADASGANLYATADNGQTVVAVDAAKLGSLRLDAKDLVFRGLSTHQEADVSAIRITVGTNRVTLKRQGEVWTEQVGDAAPVTQDPTRAKASLESLRQILGAAADSVELRRQPSAATLGTLELLEPQGNPMQSIEILQREPGPKSPRVFRSGATERAFSRPPPELERWLGTLSPDAPR